MGVVRSLENEPAKQPVEEKTASQEKSQSLIPLSKSLYFEQVGEVKKTETGCANGLCYFNQANSLFYPERKISEEAAWLVAVVVLLLSIIFNAITLSRQNSHNPFIAANTVILLMVLTSVIFWKM
ncbi:MAG: hypothetical protein NT136_01235 [Candidatus Moranbacteria bacterium]|nr:hypothetical protein [Candidatus Moranbacteria bacterium]